MSTGKPALFITRRLGVGVITLAVTAPIAFIPFSMGLMAAESVMFPLAALAIAVVTAPVASWRLAGDATPQGFIANGYIEEGDNEITGELEEPPDLIWVGRVEHGGGS